MSVSCSEMISKIWCERTKMPRLSSVFIMLLLTLFSFYLQFIVYPQSIILVLTASPLLPTSTKSYSMLCSQQNFYIIIFSLWFNLSLSASFPLPRFKHDPTSWEETSQPRTLPSLLATHPPRALVDGDAVSGGPHSLIPLTEMFSLRSLVLLALPSL